MPAVQTDASCRLDSWRWRLNRLRCMTLAEIAHRSVRMLKIQAERLAPPPAVRATDFTRSCRPWLRQAVVEPAPYVSAAERIMANRFDIFALHDIHLGDPPRWNTDPKTGVEAPLTFGKLLDYRDPRLVGDIKYLWEPNRHLHLVTLAQAYVLTGEIRFAHAVRRHLQSWIEACPYGRGPNWASALEPAMRLINWSLAWQLLGGSHSALFHGATGRLFRAQWLESVYRHCHFVHGHFSLYSSANNHLVGEAAGLYIGAVSWPHWPRSQTWQADGRAILEREALSQNAPDGVNREQAVSYQQWELDLLLLPLLAGRTNGDPFPHAYAARIEAMLEYLASIMDAGGNVPMFGDADDGHVVRLVPQSSFCRYRSLLATGALLFDRGEFKAKAGALDDKTRWLFGEGADKRYQALASHGRALPVRRCFADGGYYVLGSGFETPQEVRMVVDAGPLGYQSIAAHGHADALSFTLSVGGMEFLIDPGTYAYHTEGAWRQYFRGTAAHNTLRLDGQDQSLPGGNFMWLHKAEAGCERWQSDSTADLFEGWQDGYRRLPDPVIHRRRIAYDKARRRFLIEDRLQAAATHDVELFFHCSERCTVTQTDLGCVIEREGRAIRLRLPTLAEAECRAYRGSLQPAAGWISRRFDCKEPTVTVVWRASVAGGACLRTEIEIDPTGL